MTPAYSKVEEPMDGLIKVQKDGLYGFLSASTLKEVTPCVYTYIYDKKDGKYRVIQNDKEGYLNEDGSVARNPQ